MSKHPLLRNWAVSAIIIFCFCATWSMVTPIGASADEPAQLVKAASVVRGDIVGTAYSSRTATGLPATSRATIKACEYFASAERCERAITVVTVPESFATLFPCYGYAIVPASCGQGLQGSGRLVKATTYVGHYPPLYYLLVGWPSLAWHTNTAVYLMRLTSGLITALLLGLAIALAAVWSRRRTLLLAVVVIATPMVFIFGSFVNPSGMEMAAATCVWTGGLVLVLERPTRPPPSLVAATSAAAIVMVLTRGLSPFWLAVVGALLAVLAPRSLVTLARDRSIRIGAGFVAAASALAVIYVLWANSLAVLPVGAPVSSRIGTVNLVELTLGHAASWLSEFVGVPGSANAAFGVIVAWLAVTAAIVVTGMLTGAWRQALVLVGIAAAALVVPTTIVVSQAHRDGIVWQARDGYPLYAGVVLVAGAIAGQVRSTRSTDRDGPFLPDEVVHRLTVLIAVVVPLLQFGDLFWAVRRYVVGLGAQVNPFVAVHGRWTPPIPVGVLLAAGLLVCVAYGWWILKLNRVPSHVGRGLPEGTTTGPEWPAPEAGTGSCLARASTWYLFQFCCC